MDRLMPWLVPAPLDFRAQLKTLAADRLHEVVRLAQTELDVGQLAQLSAAIALHRAAFGNHAHFPLIRLGVVASLTMDYIANALPATALRHRLLLDCVVSNFGQVAQSILDPLSPLVDAVDAVLLALDARMLGLDRPRLSDAAAETAVEEAIATVRSLRAGVRDNLNAVTLVQTLPQPADSLFGSYDRRVTGSRRAMTAQFNKRMEEEATADGDLVVDVAHLAASVGLARWNDARALHTAKLPFALEFTPIYCEHVCRVIAAMRGKTRKCLVLDLDNTIWGGIIGDDGLEGIKLGQGSAVGEAHSELQRFALELRDRGVILAICSKNEDENARRPFREHSEMDLKEAHIAVFYANWSDKATNLRNIAETLNIGTEALVFLDDNPAERAIVRQELPEVGVPEVGSDPADYVSAIAQGGWFEAISFSDEDRNRASYYYANNQRKSAQSTVTNMDDYLLSLDMQATIAPFDAMSRTRIAQLINKSNQFNLTTRRYTEAEIAAIQDSAKKFAVQVRLNDRFGDNGMISVVIFDKADDHWECDTWLMSCRVLGRRVEEAVLQHIVAAATAAGIVRLRGTYLPTSKNALVEKHFEKLGFTQIAVMPDGATHWELAIASFELVNLPIRTRNSPIVCEDQTS